MKLTIHGSSAKVFADGQANAWLLLLSSQIVPGYKLKLIEHPIARHYSALSVVEVGAHGNYSAHVGYVEEA